MNLSMKSLSLLLVSAFVLPLSGCAVVDWMTYKLPVQQGNIVEQKDVDKLKPGMTREQVVYVLGEPLARSSFEAGRWEYVHTSRVGRNEPSHKRLTVRFDGDALVAIEGDFTQPAAFSSN